jgi:hypothetical protein
MEVATKEEFKALMQKVEQLEKEVIALRQLPPPPEWVSLEQAEPMMHKCRQTISKLARKGLLEYKKDGHRKFEIRSESIRQYNLKHSIQ